MTNKVQLFFLLYQEEVNLEEKIPSNERREDSATMHLQSPLSLYKEWREVHAAQGGAVEGNRPQDDIKKRHSTRKSMRRFTS